MTVPLLTMALAVLVVMLILMPLLRALLTRPRRRIDPTCGKCGYCVNGLITMACPECGSDLRVAGIEAYRQQMGDWDHRLKWAFALIGLIGIWVIPYGLIPQCLPMEIRLHEQRTLSNPASGAYREISIDTNGSSWAPRRPDLSIEMSLKRLDGQTASLKLLSVPVIREAGSRQPLSAELLGQWLNQNGIEPEQARVKQEIADVLLAVLGTTMPKALSPNNSGSYTTGIAGKSTDPFSSGWQSGQSSMEPPQALTWTVEALWLVLFMRGIVWAWPRRRIPSLHSDSAAPAPSA